jgi:hypothetical protein
MVMITDKGEAEREILGDSRKGKERGRTWRKEELLEENPREKGEEMREDSLEWQLPGPQEGLSLRHCP